jgi:CheY-like chemotaxis protein
MARILVVDDEKSVCNLIKNILESAGHEILVAENGKKGLAALEEHHPDLLIVDLFMPEMDGLEVIRKLRGNGSVVKIVATSGGSSWGLNFLDQAKALGACATFEKPFDVHELISIVNGCIEKA